MNVISGKQNLRLQLWVAVISALLLIAKFAAYFITGSVAILTDALESIVNVAAAFIGLYSLYIASLPKDANHPYGHGKAEFISAAVEGTLIAAAGAVIFYKGIKSFLAPQPLQQLNTGIYLIGGTAVANWLLGVAAHKQGQKTTSLALIASGKHLQTDAYSTFGIIAGLLLIAATGWQWVDPAVALLFSSFIVYTGYKILRQSLAGIMDEADQQLLQKMVHVLNAHRRKNWVDMHNLRVIKYGPVLHVDCHLTVPWYLNVNEAHVEVDALSTIIKKDFGETLELFAHSDGCLYFQCPICDKEDCRVRKHPFQKEIVWTVDNILQNQKHGLADALAVAGTAEAANNSVH